MREVTKAVPLEKFQLRVTFDDGTEGVIEFAKLTNFEGVFTPLRDPARFQQVRVHLELGTVYWGGS